MTSIGGAQPPTRQIQLAAAALNPVYIKGNKFFRGSDGSQLYVTELPSGPFILQLTAWQSFIKGIAYQQEFSSSGVDQNTGSYVDILSDPEVCERDIPYLNALEINLVRIFAVDDTQDPSKCLSLLAEAGIYVIAGLPVPLRGINSSAPRWDSDLYHRYTGVVDLLHEHTNVLGFLIGDDVATTSSTSDTFGFVKAAVRDIKAYIKRVSNRTIGVGYAGTSQTGTRTDIAAYLTCGNKNDIVDFLAYDDFQWCSNSNFDTSGYRELNDQSSNLSVPVFFSEYGCIDPGPRLFNEVRAMYGPQMEQSWSGGILFEYFNEDSGFGLVDVNGASVSVLSDYHVFSTQIAKATPTGVNAAKFTPTNTAAQGCPTIGSNWKAAVALPPAPDIELCNCMLSSQSCIAHPSLDNNTITALLQKACQPAQLCKAISADAMTQTYGSYSMCDPFQRLSYAMTAYIRDQSQKFGGSTSCSVFGSKAATLQSGTPDRSCSRVFAQAAAAGTGSVTISTTSSVLYLATNDALLSGNGSDNGSSSSAGAVAGGVVGGVVAVAAIVAALFFWRRSRQRKAGKQTQADDYKATDILYTKSELPNDSKRPPTPPAEMATEGHTVVPQLSGDERPVEMPSGNGLPAELSSR